MEDGSVTDNMARKTQIIDFFIVILIFIGNGLFYFEVGAAQQYDYEFEDVYYHRSVVLLTFGMVLSGITCVFVIIKENIQLNLDKKRFKVPHFDTLLSSDRLQSILLECFVILVHPYPFVIGKGVYVYNTQIQSDVYYSVNDFLQWFAMIRILKAGIRLINLTLWKSSSAQRICFMYGCEANTMFGVKSMMKQHPISFLFGNLLAGALYFSILLKYCEAPVNKVTYDPLKDLQKLDNCLWLVLVTMTTGRPR